MNDRDADSEQGDDAQAGWDCARLLDLARTAAAIAARLQERLQAFDVAALHAEAGAALSASELDRVGSDVLALEDAVDVMGFVATGLRARADTLIVSAEEVRSAAARALAAGSADPSFVLFAAGLLGAERGFPALAQAIADDPGFPAQWTDVSVRDLLEAFHESAPARVRRVCLAALVHPDAALSSLDLDAMERLAEALRGADA